MATGVNVKMGVSGVSQFKNAMNQAKQATKTLDAQLALTEKEFKATGDAQGYMQKKTEELKAKLEAQKSVVDNAQKALESMASNGIDRSSTAYQKLYQEMLKAKGEMLDTQAAMDGIESSGTEAANSVDSVNQQLKRIGDGVSYQNVTEALGTISAGIGNVITKAWQMGEAIVNATLGAGSWADELKTTSDIYEDTLLDFGGGKSATETLQRMRKTAGIIDTDVDTILDAQDKLKKGREGQGEEFMGALEYLGIDPHGMSDLDLFWKAGEAIAKLGKNEDKVTYAQRIFGKSWREMLPLFKAGRTEYEKTMDKWSVVEDDQIDNLGKMDDAYQSMQNEWHTFQTEMLSAFSGPLTEGMETITGLFRELNEYLDTPEGQEMLAQIGSTISDLIGDLTNIDPKDVINNLKGIIDGITTSLKWIKNNKDTVKKALEVIAGGFALIKVANLALNIGKIVNGFQTLWAGANNPLPSVPVTPGGAPTTTAADAGTTVAKGGFWAGVGNKIAAAAGGVGGVEVAAGLGFAAESALAVLLMAAWIDHDKKVAEENEKGQKKAEELVEKTEELQTKLTPEQQATWDLVVSPYKNNGGSNADLYNELIERRKTWLGGDDDPILDTLAEVLDDETWQQLMEILDTFQAGGQIYNPEDVKENYQRMLEEVEQSLGTDTQQSNSEMTEAAKGMKGLPAQVAGAVAAALNNTQVVINGEQLTHVVGVVQASDILANYSVP